MLVQSSFDGLFNVFCGPLGSCQGRLGGIEMDDKVNEILERLPAKPPRSRLDPHLTLIEEMRRRGRTFGEIARVLADECQLSTCPSNIHHFLKLRTRNAKLAKRASLTSGDTSEVASQHVTGSAVLLPTPSTAVARRIAALKQRKPAPTPVSEGFDYDPNEPLRLVKPRKSEVDR
jgi:hypothetical protein